MKINALLASFILLALPFTINAHSSGVIRGYPVPAADYVQTYNTHSSGVSGVLSGYPLPNTADYLRTYAEQNLNKLCKVYVAYMHPSRDLPRIPGYTAFRVSTANQSKFGGTIIMLVPEASADGAQKWFGKKRKNWKGNLKLKTKPTNAVFCRYMGRYILVQHGGPNLNMFMD